MLTLGPGNPPVEVPEAPAPWMFGVLGAFTLVVAARRLRNVRQAT